MEKICTVCGDTFRVKPSHADKRLTCGLFCMANLYREKMKGEGNPHWRGGNIQKVCPKCGKPFCVAPGSRRRIYCSVQCYKDTRKANAKIIISSLRVKKDYHCKLCGVKVLRGRIYCKLCSPRGKQRITSYCQVCGKPFKHWKGYNRKFCSWQCYRSQIHGEGNSNWKGGRLTIAQLIRSCGKNRKLIAQVIKRDKYTCQKCGVVGGDLEVDHIKPFADILEEFLIKYMVLDVPTFSRELLLISLKYKPFWDKKNLRTLCRNCNWQRQVEKNRKLEAISGDLPTGITGR